MKTETINRLLRDRKAKRAVALATNLATGDEALVYPSDASGTLAQHPAVVEAARDALRADRNVTMETPEGDVFIHVYNPALRFIIVGAVHIAQPLARMAALAEYDVTVVDPRGSFATDDRFPGVTLKDEWPDEALTSLQPDRRTAVITLTHDPKLDDPALEVALKSDAFYIGSLGSRKTHAARLERLQALGFTATDMARIHGPVGLSLGAKSPAEIAVSILAQVTSVLHGSDQKAAA
jgi:xanthine dehydrogenase accessory factor